MRRLLSRAISLALSIYALGIHAADITDGAPVLTPALRARLLSLSPAKLPAPPPDPTNRFADDPRAARFGQRLFFDPSFSGPLLDSDNDGSPSSLGKAGETGRIACAGCHIPSDGYSDTRSFQRQISLGAGWGRRRAPSLLDVGQARFVMWDGSHDALWNQPFTPLENVVEMNSSRLYMAEQLYRKHRREYEALFGAMPKLDDARRFPRLSAALTGCQPKNQADPAPNCDGTFHGTPGDSAEYDRLMPADRAAVTRVVINAGKALEAYERKLSCGAAPFDAWIHGEGHAISPAAQRGAALFVGQGECIRCHGGPYLSDQQFHNVGLAPQTVQQAFTDSNDRGAALGLSRALADPLNSQGVYSDGTDGRWELSGSAPREGAFRTPGLRCVAQRPAFMHTGQQRTLAEVVAFFNQGGDGAGYPGVNELHMLALTPEQQGELVEFLQSLNGPGAAPALQTANGLR